jgi:hypothetical protein
LGRFTSERQRDSLALPARELMRLAALESFELHDREHLGDARRDLRAR